MTGDTAVEVDGRHQRRARNREAVVDALLSLVDVGDLDPTIAEVAAVAGLSARSVFRYFDDVDDLVRAAVQRQQGRLAPLMADTIDPAMPLPERIHRFVSHRVELLETMGNVGRVARMRAPIQPLVADELRRIRRVMAGHVESAFGPELAEEPARSALLASMDIVTSFEAYDSLRRDHGFDRREAVGAMVEALERLLARPEPTPGASSAR